MFFLYHVDTLNAKEIAFGLNGDALMYFINYGFHTTVQYSRLERIKELKTVYL